MIAFLPTYISLFFGLTTLATWILFVWTITCSSSEPTRKNATRIGVALCIWLLLQSFLTLNNWYHTDTNSFPPKIILLGILPAMLTIIFLFATAKGRQFIDSLPLKQLTYLHLVRVPVEIVLFWLYLNKAVPQLMTFEGRNFDILAGITAPFVAYFYFTKKAMSQNAILIWNILCLGLLLNIVVNALLSTPSPIQQFAFEQPNIAILYFPFSCLPTFIVPIVLFAHLTAIRQLVQQKATSIN